MAVSADPVDRTGPAGGGRNLLSEIKDLPRSFQDVLASHKAATQELSNTAKSLDLMAEQFKTFTVTTLPAALQNAYTDAQKQLNAQAVAAVSAAQEPFMESPATRGDVQQTREMARGAARGRATPVQETRPWHTQEWRPGQRLPTATGLRQDIGRWLSERRPDVDVMPMEDREITVDTAMGPMTRKVPWIPGPDVVETPMGPVRRNDPSVRRNKALRGLFEGREATAEEVATHAGQAARAAITENRFNWLNQIGKQIATGEGGLQGVMGTLGAALPTGLMKVAGPAGMALGVANQALDFMEGQRQQNAYYRQISGGGEGGAYLERGRERMFGWRMRGTMGGAQASELFRGVSELGLTGAGREQALDFAVDKFRDYGMSVAETLQLMTTALHDGSVGFNTLSQSLDRVTEAAKEAGINTAEARRAFSAQFQALTPQIGGAAAADIATAFTANTAALGHTMAGVQIGLSQTDLQIEAARTGQSYTSVFANVTGPAGGPVAANVIRGRNERILQNTVGAQGINNIAAVARELGYDPNNLTAVQADRVGRELANRGQLNLFRARDMLGQMNITGYQPQNTLGTAVLAATGGFLRGLPSEEDIRPQEVTDVAAHLRQTMGYDRFAYESSGGTDVTIENESKFLYGSRLAQTGRSSPVIEQLFQMGIKGGAKGALFKVQDGTNPDGSPRYKQVNFDEALQNYPEQLEAGTAVLVRGQGQLKEYAESQMTVGDITGRADESMIGQGLDKNRGVGRDWDKVKGKYEEDAEERNKVRGEIVLSTTPKLDAMFRAAGIGDVQVRTTTYSTPPSQPSAGSRPTGEASPVP